MKRAPASRRQRGIAMVETAIILTTTMLLIPVVFLFGRLLYQYSVLAQATSEAAAYMASVAPLEMHSFSAAAAASERADTMVRDAVAAAGIRPDSSLAITVECDDGPCGIGAPALVEVHAVYQLDVSLFGLFFEKWVGDYSIWVLQARATRPYAN